MAPRHRSSFDSFPSGESSRRSNTPRRNEDASRPQVSAARSYSRAAYGDTGARQRAASFSRDSTQAEYARIRAKKKRRKIIGGVVGALFAVLLVGGGAALAYMGILNGKLSFGIDDETRGALVDKSLSEPFYMLLMGTDKSEDRDASGEFGDAYRSDSMMLARIDPQQKKVTLVSIERDTLVDIDGYGINKINAAYALGGPSLAVKTVSEFAGVPISHYAEINFDGFKAVVDALGGVDVNVSIDIDDPEAGGSLSAGEQTINGDQALIQPPCLRRCRLRRRRLLSRGEPAHGAWRNCEEAVGQRPGDHGEHRYGAVRLHYHRHVGDRYCRCRQFDARHGSVYRYLFDHEPDHLIV